MAHIHGSGRCGGRKSSLLLRPFRCTQPLGPPKTPTRRCGALRGQDRRMVGKPPLRALERNYAPSTSNSQTQPRHHDLQTTLRTNKSNPREGTRREGSRGEDRKRLLLQPIPSLHRRRHLPKPQPAQTPKHFREKYLRRGSTSKKGVGGVSRKQRDGGGG